MQIEEIYCNNGFIPSPQDERDYKLDKLIARAIRIPEVYINPTPLIILDQGKTSSCVACSAAQAKHIIEYNQTGDNKKFSPMYLYANRKSDDYQGEGLVPREALSNLRDFGMCHYDYFPDFYEYDEANNIYNNDKTLLDQKAYPYRISSYYRLNTVEEVKTAIYTIGFAFMAYDVYRSMYYPDKDGIVQYDKNDRHNYGGHQLLAVGYNDIGFIIVNSWGENFGVGFKENHSEGGLMIVPYDYVATECWALVDEIKEKELQEQNK